MVGDIGGGGSGEADRVERGNRGIFSSIRGEARGGNGAVRWRGEGDKGMGEVIGAFLAV